MTKRTTRVADDKSTKATPTETKKGTTFQSRRPKPTTREEDLTNVEFVSDDERVRKLPHGVNQYEEKVLKKRKDGTDYEVWQPFGREMPVLFIVNVPAFKSGHEQALRIELKHALKRHNEDGEIWFEVGRTDEEMEQVIKDSIEFLRGYGIMARREMRFSTVLHRHQW